jgi:hypothetical protein
MSSVSEWVRSSGLIFTGTVVEKGKSGVPGVKPNESLAVVQVDRGLRVDPVHGDLRGKRITVLLTGAADVKVGDRALFFTNSWIHGQGIAVREVARTGVSDETAVAEAIAALPGHHLLDRVRSAAVVARGSVERIGPPQRTTYERNAAVWSTAELHLDRVLKGSARKTATVNFPTSDHPMWARAPRLKPKERAVFLLHTPSRTGSASESALDVESFVVIDPADVQPESQLSAVEELVSTLK